VNVKSGKILYIDLEEQQFETVERPDLFEKYLGGSGVAIKLLLEECPKGIDPFSPDNPLIFASGLFNGIFPCAPKTVATFKSPITKNLGETHAGGRFATALKLSGYSALVLKNSAKESTYLEITKGDVEFKRARPLEGLSPYKTESLLREYSHGLQSIVSIGLGGERKIHYACANVDRYNFFGRLGIGSIFGSKNLKAISVTGTGELEADDHETYKKTFEGLYKEAADTNKMHKYHFVGTPQNVLVLNELKALPTKNFQKTTYEHADELSGENIGDTLLELKNSCPLCPVGCMHVAKLKPKFAQGFEYEPIDVYYNYESIYALGTNLCIKNSKDVLDLIHKSNVYCMDTMLLGNILSWATEAYEKGQISLDDTLGIKPSWGDSGAYSRMIDNIISLSNDFYTKLGQGLENAANSYGGTEFALVFGGNGPAGYHTGYAHILGTVTGGRHAHNSNAGYDIDQTLLNKPDTNIVKEIIKEEDWRYVLTSLGICMFSRKIYEESVVIDALKSLGIKKTLEELLNLGSEINNMAYEFKFREGFDFKKIRIPKRVFETVTPNGKLDEHAFQNMLSEYLVARFNFNMQ
jgi:aldehyde:ferredoxin oxidoreductase